MERIKDNPEEQIKTSWLDEEKEDKIQSRVFPSCTLSDIKRTPIS